MCMYGTCVLVYSFVSKGTDYIFNQSQKTVLGWCRRMKCCWMHARVSTGICVCAWKCVMHHIFPRYCHASCSWMMYCLKGFWDVHMCKGLPISADSVYNFRYVNAVVCHVNRPIYVAEWARFSHVLNSTHVALSSANSRTLGTFFSSRMR